MRHLFLSFLFFFTLALSAQTTLTEKLVSASVYDLSEKKAAPRKLLSYKKRSARYNPLTYVSAALLYLYQNVISEQFQAQCTYEISCSEFTKLSIQQSGFFTGTLKGFNQLSECFDAARYEHPRLFVNSSTNKIINSVDKEDK